MEIWRGPIAVPSGAMTMANVPPPPNRKSIGELAPPGPSGPRPNDWISCARRSRAESPVDSRDEATLTYSAMPRASRTRSVEPPLHATRRQRTPRTRRASLSEASRSAASSAVAIASAIGKPIAHATDGLDPAAGVAELGPQVVDVGIDRVGRDRHRERPRLVQELVARERLARVPEEALQQRELPGAQVHRPAVDGHPAAPLVQRDRTHR